MSHAVRTRSCQCVFRNGGSRLEKLFEMQTAVQRTTRQEPGIPRYLQPGSETRVSRSCGIRVICRCDVWRSSVDSEALRQNRSQTIYYFRVLEARLDQWGLNFELCGTGTDVELQMRQLVRTTEFEVFVLSAQARTKQLADTHAMCFGDINMSYHHRETFRERATIHERSQGREDRNCGWRTAQRTSKVQIRKLLTYSSTSIWPPA